MRGSNHNKNDRSAGLTGLGRTGGFEQEPDGFYPIEPKLGHALVRAERFPGGVWECACGDGVLSRIFLGAGIDTVSTDLVYRGFGRGGVDFLATKTLRRPTVATNPPFDRWDDFARHALALGARKLMLLGRLLLLEGWERSAFFRQTRLSRVLVVGRSRMRPPGTVDKGYGPAMCFAWFIWDRTTRWLGGPVVQWVKP